MVTCLRNNQAVSETKSREPMLYPLQHRAICDDDDDDDDVVACRSLASRTANAGAAVSADVGSDVSLQPTPPSDSTVKDVLSAGELDKKIVSILDEYLHICDIQVLLDDTDNNY